MLSRIPLSIRCLFVADFLAAGLYVANVLAGRPSAKLDNLLNVNEEGNLPTWYSSLQWAAVAGLFAFAAFRGRQRREPGSFVLLVISVAFLYCSLDEAARLHERLGTGLNGKLLSTGLPHSTWLLVLGIPFALVLLWSAKRIKSRFDRAPGSLGLYLIGVGVFSAGAFLIEASVLGTGVSEIPLAFAVLEETMEMVGVTFLVWSGLTLARAEGLLAFLVAPAPVEEPRKAA